MKTTMMAGSETRPQLSSLRFSWFTRFALPRGASLLRPFSTRVAYLRRLLDQSSECREFCTWSYTMTQSSERHREEKIMPLERLEDM